MNSRACLLCVCACVGVAVRGTPRSTTVRQFKRGFHSNTNDSDRTPSSPEITSSHLDVKEYSYSDIFRTLPPTNSSEQARKRRRKKRKMNKLGLLTKAGTVVASLVNGYSAIRNTFGNSRGKVSKASYKSDDDYDSDYDDSDSEPKKQSKQVEREATTMSLVEQAYRRAMTFTPRYKWDQTTKSTSPVTSVEDSSDSKSSGSSENLADKGNTKDGRTESKKDVENSNKQRKSEKNNLINKNREFNTRQKTVDSRRQKGKLENINRKEGMMRDSWEFTRRRKEKTQEYLPKRRRHKETVPWRSKSYIKPFIRNTGKVIRGLDTLAYYGSYVSYTLMPILITAIQTGRSLLPPPETVAKLESSPPFVPL